LAFSGTSADNGAVTAPDDTAEYWSNSVDISQYYALGKIMPASSTDGKKIYFTPDAAGVGKTLKAGAKYYSATNENGDGTASDAKGKNYATTLHAYTKTEKTGANLEDTRWDTTGGAYTPSESPTDTQDDGYYVDIPVWIRTSYSGTDTVTLALDAYVTSNSKDDGDDLYLATRVAVLSDDRKTNTSGLLEIRPDSYTNANGTWNNNTIVNFMDTTNAAGEAVAGLNGTNATYGDATHYDGSLLAFTELTKKTAGSTSQYGTAKKFWIRVWLEGEDPNCWNENAGQDFNISLKFTRDEMYNETAASSASVDQSYPNAIAFSGKTADSDEGSLKTGDQVKVSNAFASTFEYTGSAWVNKGTFTNPNVGQYYTAKVGSDTASGTIKSESDLITWLNTNVKTKKAAKSGVTITAVDETSPSKIEAYVVDGAVTYSVTALPSGATSFTLNGATYNATDLAAKLATMANGTYTVTVTYPAP
jgi:hypothetical protein